MAFRELHMVEIKECLRLWAQGKGYRTIAKQTGLARNTVKRHVAVAVRAGLERGDVDRALDDAGFSWSSSSATTGRRGVRWHAWFARLNVPSLLRGIDRVETTVYT